jgi:hypothetical protein
MGVQIWGRGSLMGVRIWDRIWDAVWWVSGIGAGTWDAVWWISDFGGDQLPMTH